MAEPRFPTKGRSSQEGSRVIRASGVVRGSGVVRALAVALASTLPLACGTETPPVDGPPTTGPELVAQSIAYHDPDNVWPSLERTLVIRQERPNGETRRPNIRIEVPSGGFASEEEVEVGNVRKGVADGECFASIDGAPPSDDLTESLRLDCPSVERMRNYYLYLWGLPMKLTDPGTNVDPEIGQATFDERAALSVKVTYDAEVGSDTWYFYFDPSTYQMVGYKFYHDEAAGDGEYILLRDEYDLLGMKIPAVRRWFTNGDSTFLGTDHLVEDFQGQPASAYR